MDVGTADAGGMGEAHETPGSGSDGQLHWKRTFICVQEEAPTSLRRVRSDPDLRSEGSETFGNDRVYVESLSDKMCSLWSVCARRNAGDDDSQTQTSDTTVQDLRQFFDSGFRRDSWQSNPEYTGSITPNAPPDVAIAAAAAASEVAVFQTPRPLPGGLSKHELKTEIDVQTKEISSHLHRKQRRQALSAIEELPEQVEEALQQSAADLYEEVQGNVAVMQDRIREREGQMKEHSVEKAVEDLDVIPTMVWGSLEAKVAEAKDVVRQRIDGLIQGIEADTLCTNAEMVQQIQALPSQVQQIAGEAIRAAVTETKRQAQQQLDYVIMNVPEESGALERVKLQMAEKLPSAPWYFGRAVRAAALQPINDAVAAVNTKEDEINGAVANQVVADMLLRAKASHKQPSDSLLTPSQDLGLQCLAANTADRPLRENVAEQPASDGDGGALPAYYLALPGDLGPPGLAANTADRPLRESAAEQPALGSDGALPTSLFDWPRVLGPMGFAAMAPNLPLQDMQSASGSDGALPASCLDGLRELVPPGLAAVAPPGGPPPALREEDTASRRPAAAGGPRAAAEPPGAAPAPGGPLRVVPAWRPELGVDGAWAASAADGLQGPGPPGRATGVDVAMDPSTEESVRRSKGFRLTGREDEYKILPGGNPGSIGHPDLCPRPCLYFASGSCNNGSTCEFCHLPHPKRPAHLDKRHRQMLKEFSPSECAGLVFPVLAEKVQAMDASPETNHRLLELAYLCGLGGLPLPPPPSPTPPTSATASVPIFGGGGVGGGPPAAPAAAPRSSRTERMFIVALRAMSLRLVLMSMHKSLEEQESSCDSGGAWAAAAQGKIDELLQHLRWVSYQRFTAATQATSASFVPDEFRMSLPGGGGGARA